MIRDSARLEGPGSVRARRVNWRTSRRLAWRRDWCIGRRCGWRRDWSGDDTTAATGRLLCTAPATDVLVVVREGAERERHSEAPHYRVVHPDHGGNPATFRALLAERERAIIMAN